MTELYGEDLAAIHATGFEGLANAAATILLERLPPAVAPRGVLDFGCGAGPLSHRLATQGFSIWGIDQSAAMIRRARDRVPGAEFVCASILDASVPSGSLAAAAIGEVMNYATADQPGGLMQFFRKVFDALEAGGVFLFDLARPGRSRDGRAFAEGDDWAVGVIATEDNGFLTRRIAAFRKAENGTWRRHDEVHRLRLWPDRDIVAQLSSVGFTVELLDGYPGVRMPPTLQVYLARKLA